jgi:endonuclease/exonuclease/phosphatase family metal-dependent hydrolase
VRLRLCTFNLENLFARFDFAGFSDPRAARYLPPVVRFLGDFGDGDLSKFPEFAELMRTAAVAQADDHRQHTALAIAAADADVYCLQEVDGHDALTRFWRDYVEKIGVDRYEHFLLIEGNDPRGIDVAAVTRDIRPAYARSHATLTPARLPGGRDRLDAWPLARAEAERDGRIFRRDALELEVLVGARRVTVFDCHFKSMGGGRDRSMGRRQLEALAVRALIEAKFPDPAGALWAVAGDLNDYRLRIKVSKAEGRRETVTALGPDEPSGVDPLLAGGFGANLLERLPEAERWTHYYAPERHKTQLDYVIASPALAERLRGVEVIREGMPHRVPNLDAPRYPRIGWDRPKASDHCPVVAEFDV